MMDIEPDVGCVITIILLLLCCGLFCQIIVGGLI